MRRKCAIFALLFGIVTPAIAQLPPMAGPTFLGNASGDTDNWQRIHFQSAQFPPRAASQIKIAIQTSGPRMLGRIRIPGAPASNFDTGNGLTVVDLINVGDKTKGFADIGALEVQFTQVNPGQRFLILTIKYEDGTKYAK
jgi:hypothetical protein